jgi:hypothetical protein
VTFGSFQPFVDMAVWLRNALPRSAALAAMIAKFTVTRTLYCNAA